MSPEALQNMFAYNIRTNKRVWDCAMQLSDADYKKDTGYSVGSVEQQLVHVLAVEYWWMHFLATGELRFKEEPFATRAEHRAFWDEVNDANMAYLETVTPDMLMRKVRPDFWDEHIEPILAWQGVMQVIMHSMDHRSQILRLLYDLGAPTFEQDYLYHLWDVQDAK